jgi:uncharacterized repeat protein (TIGR01451 family)
MRIHAGRLRRLLVCLAISFCSPAAFAGGGSTIGNLVWDDLDNDGLVDAGEPGLVGVTVELWSADDTTLLDTTATGGGGLYQFADFAPGLYRVRLPAADFDPGGALRDYRSSTGPLPGLPYEPAPDPDTVQVDSDDNGTEAGGPLGLGGFIETEAFSLGGNVQELRIDFGVNNSPRIDLAVTKTDGASDYLPGTALTYTIVVTNHGPADADGMTVSDARPPQIASWTWTCAPATPPAYNCTGDASNPATFTDSLDLPQLASVTYTVQAQVAPAATGDLANSVVVAPPAGMTELTNGDNVATDVDPLRAADLSLTKSDGVTQVQAGQSVTYTIVVANAGPNAAIGATVADDLPAPLGCTWTCAGAGGGVCAPAGSGDLAASVDLPAGASVTFTVQCAIPFDFVGQLANTASVAAPATVVDVVPGNDAATDVDTVTAAPADLALAKTADASPVPLGDDATFTLTVTNQGPGPATGVVVTDTLPVGLDYVSDDCGATVAPPLVTWNVGALAAGASASCAITATVSAAIPLVNTATVAGVETDPAPGDNVASATVLGGQSLLEIPALDARGLALLALALAAAALAKLRR